MSANTALAETLNQIREQYENKPQASLGLGDFWRERVRQGSGEAPLSTERLRDVVAGLRQAYASDAADGTMEEYLKEQGYDPYKYSTGYIQGLRII